MTLDIEQQESHHPLRSFEKVHTKSPSSFIYERTVSTRRKIFALLGYFVCNIGLTMYNKAVLEKFSHPWLLTSIHAASSSVGCGILLLFGHFQTTKLTTKEKFVLLGFSLLFTVNIAVSNVSLAMVSIPFHQVVRATTPLLTILIYRVTYKRAFSRATYLSLIPVVLGVSAATYGDITYTRAGFAMAFLGVVLAAVKSIVTNRMLTDRLALSPLEILYRMSPLACIQSLLIAALRGELDEFFKMLPGDTLTTFTIGTNRNASSIWPARRTALILLGNGALAFILNVSSFNTIKLAGALTMTVCANIKHCLTIVLGIFLFDTVLTTTNLWGVVVTLVGGSVYSFIELRNG